MSKTTNTRIARVISAGCMLLAGAAFAGSAAMAQAVPPDRYVGGSDAAAVRRITVKAEHGDAHAQAMLGFMYASGNGVPQSYEVAARWYLRSAEQGDPVAQYLLGLLYDKGFGVTADTVIAYKWLNLAAAHAPRQSRETFMRMRDSVGSKMTEDQLKLARRLAVDFASSPH